MFQLVCLLTLFAVWTHSKNVLINVDLIRIKDCVVDLTTIRFFKELEADTRVFKHCSASESGQSWKCSCSDGYEMRREDGRTMHVYKDDRYFLTGWYDPSTRFSNLQDWPLHPRMLILSGTQESRHAKFEWRYLGSLWYTLDLEILDWPLKTAFAQSTSNEWLTFDTPALPYTLLDDVYIPEYTGPQDFKVNPVPKILQAEPAGMLAISKQLLMWVPQNTAYKRSSSDAVFYACSMRLVSHSCWAGAWKLKWNGLSNWELIGKAGGAQALVFSARQNSFRAPRVLADRRRLNSACLQLVVQEVSETLHLEFVNRSKHDVKMNLREQLVGNQMTDNWVTMKERISRPQLVEPRYSLFNFGQE